MQGLQLVGVVVGQTLLSDQPSLGRQVRVAPPKIPRFRSMGVKRRMVSLDSETFLSSFFMLFPSINNRMIPVGLKMGLKLGQPFRGDRKPAGSARPKKKTINEGDLYQRIFRLGSDFDRHLFAEFGLMRVAMERKLATRAETPKRGVPGVDFALSRPGLSWDIIPARSLRMRILVALGGNALLRRGEAMTAENQRKNVRVAAEAMAPLGREHELVISHGNGPQVGLLALQSAAYEQVAPYPLDVLGAQTEGMIGYMIEQELGNILPFEQPFATILSMVEVDPDDPAFQNPTKPIGPVYTEEEARKLAEEEGWTMAPDDSPKGLGFRRVVASPMPKRIFQIRPVKWLLEKGCIVICAGGGGIPTMYAPGRKLQGVEAVVDKDRASALLARELEADFFIMATDADAVYLDWGKPTQRAIRRASPRALAEQGFAEGSMGPKVEAAIDFVERTGKTAAIGALADLARISRGEAGTIVTAQAEGLELYPGGTRTDTD